MLSKEEIENKLNTKDEQNIIKGLFKILEEKAEGISQVCKEGKLTGEVYDCDIHTLNTILEDLSYIGDTLYKFKNIKESKGEK